MALALSESESNIENINAEEFDGRYFSTFLTITVRDRKHLARVLRKIRSLINVIRVIREKPSAARRRNVTLP